MTDNPSIKPDWDIFSGSVNSKQSCETQPTESFFKTCPRCRTNERQVGSTGRTKPYCQSCQKDYAQERYSARRLFVDNYKMESGCESCGFNKHPAALEFDHLNPATKKYSIGSQLMSMSWEAIDEEISKCRVLCANCHQIHTHESNHYATRR